MAWISGNRYLSLAEMQNNAELVQAYGLAEGWSINAICAILGNMQEESGINPGIWENREPYVGGYGLVQWTPYTKYSNWAGSGWRNNGDKQLERISYEAANDLQWDDNFYLGPPPYSFTEFLTDDTTDLATMANYFLWYYERPRVNIQPERAVNAQYWYDFLDWENPPEPPGPEPPEPEPEFPWWILFKFRGRKGGFIT